MSEIIVLGVSKGYYNSRRRYRRSRAKPVWFGYFREGTRFYKKRVSALQVPLLKMQIRRLRTLICIDCDKSFQAYIKNDKENVDCPHCENS